MAKKNNMQKRKNKSKQKLKKHMLGIVILAFVICIMVYFLYVVIDLIISPSDVFLIKQETVSKEETVTGYIIRDEQIIESNINATEIEYIKSEGEKIAKGDAVFKYYSINKNEIKSKIEDVNLQIQEALEGTNNLFSGDVKALELQIEDKLLLLMNNNDIQDIEEYKTDIQNYINKKAKISGELSNAGTYINELMKEKENLENELSNGSNAIVSMKSGIVSYRIDGLENILTLDKMDELTKDYLENLNLKTGQIITTSVNTSKIINNFECYIAVYSDSDDAKSAKINDTLKIRLSTGEEISAKIYKINEDTNGNLLILKITNGVESLSSYRKISIDLIWWDSTGLKVPKTAIIYENGLSYVVRNKLGTLDKILVKIKKENDNYCIITNYDTDELLELGYSIEEINSMKEISVYDEIIVNPNLD